MADDFTIPGAGVETPTTPEPDQSTGEPTDDSSSSSSSSSYSYMDSEAGSAFMNVLVAYLAILCRHIITPELWLQFTPGRWLAFAVATAKVESSYQANAVNPSSGAAGLFQYTRTNVSVLGVDAGSVWSQGWHAPELLAQSVQTFGWWLRMFLPGGTSVRALWHYGPDDPEALEKAAQEETFLKTYWMWRLIGLVIDVPYAFILPAVLVYSLKKWGK